MKRMLKYAALIATVLVICSSAWANTYVDHINTAPNNKGDVLIFPWFLAIDGGWQTKLTVINTDEVNSVVAKVVFRSFKNSEELLDFLIFLSPADVWTGKIYYNTVSKTVKVFSDDDSVLTATTPTFATPQVPVDQAFFPVQCTDDADFLGYVEVIEAAWGPVSPAKPGVTKTAIYNAYGAGTTAVSSPLVIGSINVLAGYMEFGNPVLGLMAGYRATTLRDYDNRIKLTAVDETKLGAAGSSNNSMAEIEASFTKDNIALPYVKGDDVALHFFTFPTKLTDFTSCTAVSTFSPYFQDNMDSKTCIPYSLTTYDLKENSPQTGSPFSGGTALINKFCYEVNAISSADFPYAEGWGAYSFKTNAVAHVTNDRALDQSPLRYLGAPVIPTYLYLGKSGLSSEYGSWTDSYVFNTWTPTTVAPPVAAEVLTDYQYTDEATEHTTDPTKR